MRADNESDKQSEHRSRSESNKAERLSRQIAVVIRLVVLSLNNKLFTEVCKGVECLVVVSAFKIRHEFVLHILLTPVSEVGYALAAGGYSPVTVFHADKEEYSVMPCAVAEAVIVKVVISVSLRGLCTYAVLGDYYYIKLMLLTERIKLFKKICFLAVGDQIGLVNQSRYQPVVGSGTGVLIFIYPACIIVAVVRKAVRVIAAARRRFTVSRRFLHALSEFISKACKIALVERCSVCCRIGQVCKLGAEAFAHSIGILS